jgi:hypothetical protein
MHICCHNMTFNCTESHTRKFHLYICVITMTEHDPWHCSYHVSKSYLAATEEIVFLSPFLNSVKHMTNNMISSFKEICHRQTYMHKCMHVCMYVLCMYICMYVCMQIMYVHMYIHVCMGVCFSNTIIRWFINKLQYKPMICHEDKGEHWTESQLLKSYFTQTISGAASWWNYNTVLPSSHHPVTNILTTNIITLPMHIHNKTISKYYIIHTNIIYY